MLKNSVLAGSTGLGGDDGQAILIHSGDPNQSEVIIMSKGLDAKKQAKKKPLKTAHEKRMAKRDKRTGRTLLGSHAAE